MQKEINPLAWLCVWSLVVFGAVMLCKCTKKITPEVEMQASFVSDMKPEKPVSFVNDISAVIESPKAKEYVTIYFGFDQKTLSMTAVDILAEIGRDMRNDESMSVTFNGHADKIGSDEYNHALSIERALACQKYLISYGISAGRIVCNAFGEERPVVEGETIEELAPNRRAEIKGN